MNHKLVLSYHTRKQTKKEEEKVLKKEVGF